MSDFAAPIRPTEPIDRLGGRFDTTVNDVDGIEENVTFSELLVPEEWTEQDALHNRSA